MSWPRLFQPRKHSPVKVCRECRQDWPCETELERTAMQERVAGLHNKIRKAPNDHH